MYAFILSLTHSLTRAQKLGVQAVQWTGGPQPQATEGPSDAMYAFYNNAQHLSIIVKRVL